MWALIIRVVIFLVMSYATSSDLKVPSGREVSASDPMSVSVDYGGLTTALGVPAMSFRTLLILVAIGVTIWHFRWSILSGAFYLIKLKTGVDLSRFAPTQQEVETVVAEVEKGAESIAKEAADICAKFNALATTLNGGKPVNFKLFVKQSDEPKTDPAPVNEVPK